MDELDSSVCPHCAEKIASGAALCRHCQRGLDPSLFRACPLCREMIRKEATACRFCNNKTAQEHNESLDHANQTPPPNRESGGLSRFNLPQIGKLFKPPDKSAAANGSQSMPLFGETVRNQVFEVIVRQALAGAPWKEICAGPMHVNNITPQEVEAEIRRRRAAMSDNEAALDSNGVEHFVGKCEKLIARLLRTADDITGTNSQLQRNILTEDIRELSRQLTEALYKIKEQADNIALASAILQSEVDRYDEKYDSILDLVNERDKIIAALKERLDKYEGDGS